MWWWGWDLQEETISSESIKLSTLTKEIALDMKYLLLFNKVY